MLFDVTYCKGKLVDSSKLESDEIIQAFKRKLHAKTVARCIKTIDDQLNSLTPSEQSKLIWTRASALVGHSSMGPKKHIDHLWDSLISIVGDERLLLITMGTLLRWRVSLREENWLVYRRDSNLVDEVSGRTIKISEYWINENHKPLNTAEDLIAKFNCGL